ncbi:MAG TPA: hypothetical protein DEA78_26255 [Cyanobacteria bacterium UBA11159]|nr:hypothetical protein [Cyanobacteria bacterium UBA11159]
MTLISTSATVVLPLTSATITLASQKQNSRSYIGLRYRESPPGVEYIGGWVIGDSEYGVSHLKEGKKEMLWLNLISSPDTNGDVMYEVKDILNLPSIKSNEELAGFFCLVDGQPDAGIIAIVVSEEVEYRRQIRRAWRANPQTARFERISTRGIACPNPGWGV